MLSETADRMCKKNLNVKKLFPLRDLLILHINDEVNKMSLLHYATLNDNLLAVKFLVEHGADVNSCSRSSGNTPLHWARSYAVAEHLLENNADMEAKNYLELTPLVTAYFTRSFEVMRLLISKNADTTDLRNHLCADPNCNNNDLVRRAEIKYHNFHIENCDAD